MDKGKILVELQEWMGSDISVANAAWTSTYDKDKREAKYDDTDKVNALVERLIKEGHSVPVESVIFRFWIRMPIFTDRQHMTHRIASHNGLSGRYRTMPDDYFHLPEDVFNILDKCREGDGNNISYMYESACEHAMAGYKASLVLLKEQEKLGLISNQEFKRCREVLRGCLPVSNMTERTTIMNLRSFANYQRLRNSDHAQPEIRFVAQRMLEEVEKANICPVTINTLKEIGWSI